MIYFLNSNFNDKNSGIEHAEMSRARLFRDHHVPFQILLREWNPRLHEVMGALGFADTEYLNLFDFYQDVQHVDATPMAVETVDFGLDQLTYAYEADRSRYIVTRRGQIVRRINVYPHQAEERVRSVELFDAFANLYKVDFYDVRGFLSLAQWYSPDNQVEAECWYRPSGEPAIEAFNRRNAAGEFSQSGWLLHTTAGATRSFDNLAALFAHFLDDVNARDFDCARPNIFVLDRTEDGDWALPQLRQPAYTALHLHNAHVGDPQHPATAILNNHYEYALSNVTAYDAVITATAYQQRDVQARFNLQAQVFTIPVGVVPETTLQVPRRPMAQRRPHSMLVTARIAPEKQLDQLVEAVGMAKRQVPDITLDIYGYVDHSNHDEAIKKLRAMINRYDLGEQVRIHDYQQDLRPLQQTAQIYGLTSVMEGFNLALMEAQAQGVVGVTYDVNYGPNELVVDEVNGYVVPYGDVPALAERLVRLMTDDALLQRLSDAAYTASARFSPDAVWQQWQNLLTDAARIWPLKLAGTRMPVTAGQ